MIETTLKDQNNIGRRPSMRGKTIRNRVSVLLFIGALGCSAGLAQAEPVNHPEACQGKGVPDGAFSCELTKGNKTICTANGDWMCCKPNAQGGYDCDQIEAKISNPARRFQFTAPVGPLQNAPVTSVPPKTSIPRAPTTGTNKQ